MEYIQSDEDTLLKRLMRDKLNSDEYDDLKNYLMKRAIMHGRKKLTFGDKRWYDRTYLV